MAINLEIWINYEFMKMLVFNLIQLEMQHEQQIIIKQTWNNTNCLNSKYLWHAPWNLIIIHKRPSFINYKLSHNAIYCIIF